MRGPVKRWIERNYLTGSRIKCGMTVVMKYHVDECSGSVVGPRERDEGNENFRRAEIRRHTQVLKNRLIQIIPLRVRILDQLQFPNSFPFL